MHRLFALFVFRSSYLHESGKQLTAGHDICRADGHGGEEAVFHFLCAEGAEAGIAIGNGPGKIGQKADIKIILACVPGGGKHAAVGAYAGADNRFDADRRQNIQKIRPVKEAVFALFQHDIAWLWGNNRANLCAGRTVDAHGSGLDGLTEFTGLAYVALIGPNHIF